MRKNRLNMQSREIFETFEEMRFLDVNRCCVCNSLRTQTKLGGAECMSLCHSQLCAVQAVQNEPAKEWTADQSGGVKFMFALMIDPV